MVVRSIDSDVIDLFRRAEIVAGGGPNDTTGGITHSEIRAVSDPADPGSLMITIQPKAACDVGAGWRLKGDNFYNDSGAEYLNLSPGRYTLQLKPINDHYTAPEQDIDIVGGGVRDIEITYVSNLPIPVIASASTARNHRESSSSSIATSIGSAGAACGPQHTFIMIAAH